MTPKEVAIELRKIQEKCKNDKTPTFGIRVSDMAKDAADAIEEQQQFIGHIGSLNSCNDCSNRKCAIRPKLGTSVRYNCFFHMEHQA